MKKIYLLVTLPIILLCMSCSDRKNDEVTIENKTVISKITSTFYDTQSSPNVYTDVFAYDNNGNMTKMYGINADGYSIFEYSSDKKLNKIIHYGKDNKTIKFTDIFTYQGDQLIKYIADYEDKTSNRIIEYTYDNNGNLKTTSICEGPPCPIPHKTTFSYTDGNVKFMTSQSPGNSYIPSNEYSYDNKQNPFINMNKYLRILLSGRYLMSANNVVTEKMNYSSSVITYTIDYNTEGFPTKILGKDQNNNKWVQYNYEYIKL